LSKRQGYTKRQSLYRGASLKNIKVTKTKQDITRYIATNAKQITNTILLKKETKQCI